MRSPLNRHALRALLCLTVAIGIAACTKKTEEGTTAGPRRDPSIMDSTELRDGNYSTVYDALMARHPDWLLPRGGPQAGRPPELGVWIEGQLRTRPVDYLKTIRPVDIKQVKRLSITEALHTYSWPWGGVVLTPR